jgi:hypothetical protein
MHVLQLPDVGLYQQNSSNVMLERTFCYIIYISQWLEGRKIITTPLNYKGELLVCKMYCLTEYIFVI